jgi:internalin A
MPKPPIIASLEKTTGIKFKAVKSLSDIKFLDDSPCYSINESEQLVGLNLYNQNLPDYSFLSELSELLVLDISYIENITDYSFLKKLNKLEVLDVSNSSHFTDTNIISHLVSLKELWLKGTNINTIDPLKALVNIEYLNIGLTDIKDVEVLTSLKHLQNLQINETRVSNISPLLELPILKFLGISNLPITDYSLLKSFPALIGLYVKASKNFDIAYLSDLTHLGTLDLSENHITDYSILEKFQNLRYLYLERSGLTDISFLQNLTSLRHLYLPNNKVRDLRPLSGLTQLEGLQLAQNEIEDITPITELIKKGIPLETEEVKSQTIGLYNNPLKTPPLAIVKQGNASVLRYIQNIKEEGIDYIYEAKVTLTGEGSSGKTSLQVRILNDKAPLPTEDTRTRGIKINDWNFDKSNLKYTAHIWDFGGQDVYYPVHRFFLTENSVFVLLASSRQTNHNFDYWIPTIFQFGGKSPIILCQTCHMGNKTPWNDIGTYLSNPHFNIIKTKQVPYFEMDLPNSNEGLQDIKNAIIHQINSLPHFGKGVPKSWIPVRIAISEESKLNACLTFEKFHAICEKINPQKFSAVESVEDIAAFLHSLGIILWYKDHEDLKDFVILQPDWAMNAVYKIIDDTDVQNQRGIIFDKDFKRLWADKSYTGKHEILKKMLQVFKIAFPKRHIKKDYIIPARLLSMPKENMWPPTEASLRLEYHYEFMPKGLINQLSAELSRLIISDNDVWNNAVNLQDENKLSEAQIIEDAHNRKISIMVKGKDARGLLSVIMNAMKDIIDGYKGVTSDIKVPCNCSVCQSSVNPTFFKYSDLIRLSSQNRKTVPCIESDDRLSIDQLLFSVNLSLSPKGNRDGSDITGTRPLKAFISYSKYDGELNKDGNDYINDFKAFMNPLIESNKLIQAWDDSLLIAGEEPDKRIKEELQSADIIFLLVSKDFLNTPYILDTQIEMAIERYNRKECAIIPIIIKPCGWKDNDLLKGLEVLPGEKDTVSSWKNKTWNTRDDVWLHVYEEVKRTINAFATGKRP